MKIAKQINRQRPLGIVYMTISGTRKLYDCFRNAKTIKGWVLPSFVDHGTWGLIGRLARTGIAHQQ